MSAIASRGALWFTVFTSRFTAKVLTGFLDRLARQAGRKVHVIADRHPVHRSKAVRTWLNENTDRIELHLFPGYSPELNPDELLNADLKRHVHARRTRSADDLAHQLWTQAGVRDLITKLYRVRLTEQGVGKYLRRWRRLSFQCPDKRAVEQDAETVRVWREETWSAIHAKAKAEGGEVPLADQVGPAIRLASRARPYSSSSRRLGAGIHAPTGGPATSNQLRRSKNDAPRDTVNEHS
jgi:transposase